MMTGPHRSQEGSRSDDRAVTEVMGFIMMFALSAMILIFTMRAFDATATRTERASAGVQLQGVADRVASRVVQAGLVAERFPNTTFTVDADLPAAVEGHRYYVTGTNATVYVNSTNEQVETNSTTFETQAIEGVWIHGTVYSGPWNLEVHYEEKPHRESGSKDILLRQG